MWYFSLAMTAVYRVTASARLVSTHHEAQGAHRALAIQDMQLQAWNSDAAALVIDRGEATSVVVEIATMSEQYRLGAASDVAESFCCQEITNRVACFVGRVHSRFHCGRRMRQKALWRTVADQGVIAGLAPDKELYGANRSVYL